MNTQSALHIRSQPYHAELRLFIASTSRHGDLERACLQQAVLPELRRRSSERGVIVIDRDPRWEISLAPAQSREIALDRMNELHGYRPIFIGILGDGGWSHGATERAPLPWLRDMATGDDPAIALDFIEHVLDNQLMQERAFFYMIAPPEGEQASHEGDASLADRLGRVHERVRRRGLPLREGIADIERLGNCILDDLLLALDRLHPSFESFSLLEQIRRSHRSFAGRLQRSYEEVPQYFDRLDEYVMGEGPPLVVSGRSGSGKSALIANWMGYFQPLRGDYTIICHHVEALSSHGDHGPVLRHLMAELRDRYAISDPLPDTASALTEAFPEWLARIGDRRLVLIIDGLDQLDLLSHSVDWLPDGPAIPPNVRLVVTTTHAGEAGDTIVDRLLDRDWQELRVKPLTAKQQRLILTSLITDIGDDAGAALLKRFTHAADTSTPLFIRMRAGQIRSADNENERNELLNARNGDEFLERMFAQLERRFGGSFFASLMQLLWGARRGLLETELCELTGIDREGLNTFLSSAGSYLVEQDGLWRFAHNKIRAAIERRYLPKAKDRRDIHIRLATYFAAQPATTRRADEEPWQWEQAGERRRLAECIADIGIFMRSSAEDRKHELLQYWVRLNDEKLLTESYRKSFSGWCAGHPDPHDQAEVAERLGTFLTVSGLLREAEHYLRSAHELFMQSRGPMHADTARAKHMLGELLRQTGTFAEAAELLRAALAAMESILPPGDAAIAQVLSDIGLLYRDSGEYSEALPYYERALNLKEQILGGDHPATAELLNDLALFYVDVGKFDRAIALYLRAVDINERRLGERHPAVATVLNNLAGAYWHSNDLDRAEECLQRALEIRRRMLGENHPHTLVTIANLASLLYRRKKLGEARALFKHAIESAERSLGDEHPNVIQWSINYAALLRESNEDAAAEEILRRMLTLAPAALGATHPAVATCANNLATILRGENRDDEAAPLLVEAIEIWRVSIGAEHPNVAAALHSLGLIRTRQQQHEAAADLFSEALAIREKYYGPDHELTVATRELLEKLRAADT